MKKKTVKSILSITLALTMSVSCLLAFSGCSKDKPKEETGTISTIESESKVKFNDELFEMFGKTYSEIKETHGAPEDVLWYNGYSFVYNLPETTYLGFSGYYPSEPMEPEASDICEIAFTGVGCAIEGLEDKVYSHEELSEISGAKITYDGVSAMTDYHIYNVEYKDLNCYIETAVKDEIHLDDLITISINRS